ncbi:MAG: hypothetical protein MUC35_01275 [Candidatus Margulisbacteria bacterium]|jgi:hypothetical protein|nr:hypothetical protein [Candidatus Margulisiibacteriota bacterium]
MSTSAEPACAIGAYVNGLDNLTDFQTRIGKQLAVVLWYVPWPEPFPRTEAERVAGNGSVPLITWEPWREASDDYVRAFLTAAKDFGRPLLLRFAHEMNGDWYPWAGDPVGFKKRWSYIYNVKRELRADNVALVFCPNHYDKTAAALEEYYPGDALVDWVGLDGYNWGEGKWETFDVIFRAGYDRLTALTAKPLMIGEFASAERGGDKAAWITDAFTKLQTVYPRVKLFCWFNINKERDWRVNSSPESQAALKSALQNAYFSSKM